MNTEKITYRGKERTPEEISEMIKKPEQAWTCSHCGKDAYNCKCYFEEDK